MKKEKIKVIIDTDPGVDDSHALCHVLNDDRFDIKLLTIVNGNIDIRIATRNMCHILDMFNKDIPVVQGYEKRLGTNTEDAAFLHGVQGLGGYLPPKTTKHKPLNVDAADAIYEVLKANPKEITFVVLGPHTNLAYLLRKHPDAKELIKDVLMMGGAPFGIKANPNHNSFNIRTDAPAFKETIDSNLPVVMCPSSIGRDCGYFTEAQVEQIKNTNEVGEFLAKTFEGFWEPNYAEKIIATNDICTIYYPLYPKIFKVKKAFIEVDTENSIGKTIPHFSRKGNFKIVVDMNRKKFIKYVFNDLEKMNNIKLAKKSPRAKKTAEKK